MSKAKKNATVDTERLVQALEGLIRDYRAGKGDVLNRIVNDQAPDFVVRSLKSALTAALFGNDALPKEALNGGEIVCTKREHHALFVIGSGSAEKGAALIVQSARSWLKRDRPGMVAWASRAIPKLEDVIDAASPITARGLFAAEVWEIPVRSLSWFNAIQDVADEAVKGDSMADCVIRAMALSWSRGDFVGTTSESRDRLRRAWDRASARVGRTLADMKAARAARDGAALRTYAAQRADVAHSAAA